jgi:nitronate monooxygenase
MSTPVPPLTELLGTDLPILEAPMAGAVGPEMAIAVCAAGGLGALACALLPPEAIRAGVAKVRAATDRPYNLNFFCHEPPPVSAGAEARWRRRLAPYFAELGVDPASPAPNVDRAPFDVAACELIEELRPPVVSFHFGLPRADLVERVKATGARVLSSATTVDEAQWLEDHGCDAIIAQGFEAGGHRGMFLSDDVATQIGTLVPQVVDAVRVPVIAAGGIADRRGVVAAFALGASGVQVGTAFLLCPEALVSPLYAKALRAHGPTAITTVFTGRPARSIVNRLVREVGPLAAEAPPFPLAAGAVMRLRGAAEANGASDFTSLWSGQAAMLARETTVEGLVTELAAGLPG